MNAYVIGYGPVDRGGHIRGIACLKPIQNCCFFNQKTRKKHRQLLAWTWGVWAPEGVCANEAGVS